MLGSHHGLSEEKGGGEARNVRCCGWKEGGCREKGLEEESSVVDIEYNYENDMNQNGKKC